MTDDIKTARFIVRGYSGRGTGSKLIKWFTRGAYSHNSVVIIIDDYTVEYESLQGSGVVRHTPNTLSSHTYDSLEAPLSKEQVLAANDLLLSLVGAKYDWKGVFGFVLKRKKHLMSRWFCSELLAFVLYKVKYPLSRRDPYRETPSSTMESFRLFPLNAPDSQID